ncbi:hypothetical protein M8C21_008390 [Ambrosia artemisiifolia]|uniref:Protein XRI1-like protein n=1 Tax=Ambrosia artemisiifolia TaxID=4212 RepID=A0AAD5CBY8_AMBAR|nr:hypothetical protein M8C21_008390 [Ambrosia artemisiifolia]
MCESVFSGNHCHPYAMQMGSDLHSIAYFTDHHLLNRDMISHFGYDTGMEMNNTPPLFYDQPLIDFDNSSGYLEDALFEFRSKRRRLMMPHDDLHHFHPSDQNTSSFPSYWDFSTAHDFENFVGGDNSTSSSQSKSSISGQFFSDKETFSSPDHVSSGDIKEDKKKVITRVVYPFALVKPGGFKGDMTLNDINERILMPPTRPVRHPVGDFACRPLVSLDGPGLSGKVVVALTRIQTHGRGTITIIRTKN